MSTYRLTHGELARLGIGHEPWCPQAHLDMCPTEVRSQCWCEYDARADQAMTLIRELLQRWGATAADPDMVAKAMAADQAITAANQARDDAQAAQRLAESAVTAVNARLNYAQTRLNQTLGELQTKRSELAAERRRICQAEIIQRRLASSPHLPLVEAADALAAALTPPAATLTTGN